MNIRRISIFVAMPSLLFSPTLSLAAVPFHDAIPMIFHGVFAPSRADCADAEGVNLISIDADGVHYYEGDDYLLIGVEFEGASTKSGKFVHLFNGRFTGRTETYLLGETNVRMEMETPTELVRFRIGDDGEPDRTHEDILFRCEKPTIDP